MNLIFKILSDKYEGGVMQKEFILNDDLENKHAVFLKYSFTLISKY